LIAFAARLPDVARARREDHSMAGERDLRRLLADLRPVRREGEFVVVSRPRDQRVEVEAAATVDEGDEGVTHVVRRELADERGWAYDFVGAWLTMQVHSALDAVGMTAAMSTALTEAGISCNVLAGYHHDHLLVPSDRADEAIAVLRRLGQDDD
jgi:hypothetical protein